MCRKALTDVRRQGPRIGRSGVRAHGVVFDSQFTSLAFTQVLKDADIKISMDGKGRWMDNVFIERLWRSSVPRHGFWMPKLRVVESGIWNGIGGFGRGGGRFSAAIAPRCLED